MIRQSAMKILIAATIGGLGLWIQSAASAASIGIQFVNANKNPTFNLQQTQALTAGVVPQNHWNSMVSGQSTATSISNLTDSTGTTIAGTAVSISGGAYYSASGAFPSGSGDQALSFSTYLAVGGGNPSAVISGIPYATYDVYFYGTNDTAASGGRHTSVYDGSTYVSFLASNSENSWILATGTWNGTGTPPTENVATYGKFTGKTGSSLTISWKTYGNSGINGIQIVDTSPAPEPATVGLLAIGGLLMISHRRKA